MDDMHDRSNSGPPVLVTVNHALALLGIGRTTFYAMLSNGQLTAVKFGRRTLVPYVEIQRWSDSLPQYRRSVSARRGPDPEP